MEAEPTPAFLTVVGISSDIHIHSIENEEETQKLKILKPLLVFSFCIIFWGGQMKQS